MAITSVTNQFLQRALGLVLVTFSPVLFGNLAHAQGTTDPGQSCIESLGYQACAGMGSGGGGGAPMVYLHFAAIVVSPSMLQAGSAHGQPSPEDAVNAAMRNCRSIGATDCRIVASGSSCMALAIHFPGGPYRVGTGANRVQAAANALAIRPNTLANSVVISAPCGSDDIR
jgi:hypothetical protein